MALFNFTSKKKPETREEKINEVISGIRTLLRKEKEKPLGIEKTFEQFLSSTKDKNTIIQVFQQISAKKYQEAMITMQGALLFDYQNQLMQGVMSQNNVADDIVRRSNR